jgi:hypothetical protein
MLFLWKTKEFLTLSIVCQIFIFKIIIIFFFFEFALFLFICYMYFFELLLMFLNNIKCLFYTFGFKDLGSHHEDYDENKVGKDEGFVVYLCSYVLFAITNSDPP